VAPHRVSAAILALVFLFLVTLVGMRVASLEEDRAAAVARSEAGMRNLARVADQYAQRVFETSDLIAQQIVARTAELGGVQALRGSVGIHHWLRDLSQGSAGDYLLAVDAAGRPVATSYMHPAPEVDLSDRRWFRIHRDAGLEAHIGEALHSRITDELLFTYSRILRRPDGSFDGVIQVAVRTGFFQQPNLAAEFGSGTVLGLFDDEGRVLARTGLIPAQLGISLRGTPLFAAQRDVAQGTLRTTLPFDGTERVVAFRRLERWPVLVTASVPLAEALTPWRRAMRWSVEVIGAVALGLLLLAAIAIRLTRREARARADLAAANRALRESTIGLEARVAERTRELTASERRFRVAFDSTFQLMVLLDPEGRVLEANGTALQFLGLPRDEVRGRRLAELALWPDSATRARLSAAVQAAAAGTPRREEMPLRTAEGRLAPVDVSLRPVRDAEGRISWLVAEGHDLTELKAAEARLRESQKMEALGQLTGGVAHDFNNLLMVVLGNLGLLRKRLPPEPRLMRLLDGAQQGAERGAALTARMLAFARRQELRPAPTDLTGLVSGLVPLLERSAGPTVRIEPTLPPGLPPALVDANQLELALLNLVVNARDAMPGGGTVTIALTADEAPSAVAPPYLVPGRYLRLSLSDTGQGMDAATLARAAEPFFTTKAVGQGSGLGLSMVQGLAEQSGGGLRLTSRPGEGTTAEIWLPRVEADAPAAAPPRPRAAEQADAAPRRILVVDDDPLVAAGTAMMLEDLGHSALLAASGEEALASVTQEPALDLVLTDHAMPGMTGLELAERLRAERPDLPVALATGYAEASGISTPWLPRLNKPYRQDELDELVRRLTRAKAA
jgi:PAS domain S-box-containing protein